MYRSIFLVKSKETFQIISAPKGIDTTKFLMEQKEKTYNTFLFQQNNNLSIFMIIVTLFGFCLAIIIGLLTFFGYSSFRKQFENIKKEVKTENQNYMNSYCIKPLSNLNERFDDLIKDLEEKNINKSSPYYDKLNKDFTFHDDDESAFDGDV